MKVVDRHVFAVLVDEALRARFEGLAILGRPPVAQISLGIEMAALVIEAVRQFVADYRADAAHVDRIVGAHVEKWRLKNAGWEIDVVLLRVVVGVDCRRAHAPLGAIHRFSNFCELADGFQIRWRAGNCPAHRREQC